MTAKRKTVHVGTYGAEDSGWQEQDWWEGDWMSTDPVDMTGRAFQPGDFVAKATTSGRAVNLEVRRVDRVENGKVYLGEGNKRALDYPGRCLIVDNWPLADVPPAFHRTYPRH